MAKPKVAKKKEDEGGQEAQGVLTGKVTKKKPEVKIKLPSRVKKNPAELASVATIVSKDEFRRSTIGTRSRKKSTVTPPAETSSTPANESFVAKRTRARTKVVASLRSTVVKRRSSIKHKPVAAKKKEADEKAQVAENVPKVTKTRAGPSGIAKKNPPRKLKKAASEKDLPAPQVAEVSSPKAGPSGYGRKNPPRNLKRAPTEQSGEEGVNQEVPAKRKRGKNTDAADPPQVRGPKSAEPLGRANKNPPKSGKLRKAVPEDAVEVLPEAGSSKAIVASVAPMRSARVAAKTVKSPQKASQQSDDESSDKENVVTVAEVHSPPPQSLEQSGEEKKKPVYKILDAKSSAAVPKDKLIVMEEKPMEEDEFDFPLSQTENDAQPKMKKRKPKVAKPMKKKSPKGQKMWNQKDVNKVLRKKETAAELRAAKLQAIPSHIRDKIKEKEMMRKSLQTSTPIRSETVTSGRMQMHENMSPIPDVSHPIEEDDEVDPPAPEEKRPQNAEAPALPWRPDDSANLPTTTRILHSERDYLPSYSSPDVTLKATPTKPKPQSKFSKSAESDKSADQQTPGEAESSNLHLSSYFGFVADEQVDEEEVDPAVLEKHTEKNLKEEQERVKQLKNIIPTTQRVPETSSQQSRPRRNLQQLTLDQAIPSTSKAQSSAEVAPMEEDPVEEQTWKDSTGVKSYERPRRQKKGLINSSDEEDDSEDEAEQHEEATALDEASPPPEVEPKTRKYKKKAPSKPKVNKKDLERERELEEFYTSFNKECEEVDKFEPVVER